MQDGSVDWSTHSLRWFADRNPFYLLSACCGLLGCWLLGSIARQEVLDVGLRIAGILAYELLVVYLGVWLAKKESMRRDAAILSVLTLILLADFSFFYTQAAMLKWAPAALFTLFGCAQSLTVMNFLLKGFGVQLPRFGAWLLAVNLCGVHLLPLALRYAAEHQADLPLAFLVAFAAAGAAVGAHALPLRWRLDRPDAWAADADFAGSLAGVLARLAPAVALMSLFVHLIAVEWMYEVHFMTVFASPLFLGLACMYLLVDTSGDRSACTLAVFAVLLALGDAPAGAMWYGGGWSWLGFSPLRIVLVAAAAVSWQAWRIQGRKRAFVLGIVTSFAAFLGHTPQMIARHFDDLCTSTIQLLWNFLPVSRQGWGLFLFSFAFVLLAAGAWLSRWKTRDSR
jgi:hypothetical protein